MLKHGDIWKAIDRLAAKNNFSPSGLARRAGLDPTTFNPSKRKTAEGKLRWPSTESIAKILEATGASMAEFTQLMGDNPGAVAPQRVPIIGSAQAGAAGYFDDAGYPAGTGWDEVDFPDVADPHAYALEISGDSMEPVYRDGDIIIVSPESSIRKGDRVVVRTLDGEVMAKELLRQSVNRLELGSLNEAHPPRSLKRSEVDWVARVIWASQ
jgi:phage repressor protein C with HTH and peptisase S24 domain